MRAAVMEALEVPLRVCEMDVAEPGPREVVVRMTASGVCHTDRHMLAGGLPFPPPLVLGHEGCGIVERVGNAVTRARVGDTVITAAVPVCGSCWFCVRGEASRCRGAVDLHGSRNFRRGGESVAGFSGLGTFAEVATVHEASVVAVESDLPAEQLALIGCGVVTGVGAVTNTAGVVPGSSVAVYGCGGVGLSAIQAAHAAGAARIVGIDPEPLKRETALLLGATDALDPREIDPVTALADLTAGRGVDYAFEAIGSADTYLQTWRSVRPGGTAVVIGLPTPGTTLSLPAQEVLLSGRTLVSSTFGGGDVRELFPTIVALAESGRIDLAAMVSRMITIDDVNQAFDDMDAGLVIRSVIKFT